MQRTTITIDRSDSGRLMPSMPEDVPAVDDLDPRLVDVELQRAGLVVVEAEEQVRCRTPASRRAATSATTLSDSSCVLGHEQHDEHAGERE